MNEFNFDLDLVIEIAKKYGVTVTEGTGQITMNGKPLTSQRLSNIMNFEHSAEVMCSDEWNEGYNEAEKILTWIEENQ